MCLPFSSISEPSSRLLRSSTTHGETQYQVWMFEAQFRLRKTLWGVKLLPSTSSKIRSWRMLPWRRPAASLRPPESRPLSWRTSFCHQVRGIGNLRKSCDEVMITFRSVDEWRFWVRILQRMKQQLIFWSTLYNMFLNWSQIDAMTFSDIENFILWFDVINDYEKKILSFFYCSLEGIFIIL